MVATIIIRENVHSNVSGAASFRADLVITRREFSATARSGSVTCNVELSDVDSHLLLVSEGLVHRTRILVQHESSRSARDIRAGTCVLQTTLRALKLPS